MDRVRITVAACVSRCAAVCIVRERLRRTESSTVCCWGRLNTTLAEQLQALFFEAKQNPRLSGGSRVLNLVVVTSAVATFLGECLCAFYCTHCACCFAAISSLTHTAAAA